MSATTLAAAAVLLPAAHDAARAGCADTDFAVASTRSEAVRNGAVRTGELDGTAMSLNGVLAFTMGYDGTLPYDKDDDTCCRVLMLRRGPYLTVKDDMGCGGATGLFSGVHRRRG